MLFGLLTVFAQTCAVMLPATSLEFEWFRDGKPYAQDVLIRTRQGERLYQRTFADGRTAERTVSCTRVGRATYLTERVGNGVTVRIPVELETGETRAVSGTTVRRVRPPTGAAANMIWFTVASPGVRLYGMRRAAGITEIRTPVRGGYSVLRAIARNRANREAADSQFTAMARRVEELEDENRRLRDSIDDLLTGTRRYPPPAQPGAMRVDTLPAGRMDGDTMVVRQRRTFPPPAHTPADAGAPR